MGDKPLVSKFDFDAIVTTTEMHTGGEAVRIIESGYPVPQGETLLDKMQYLKENFDEYRKFVMHEPRGHFDVFGVIPVKPDNPEADMAVIFIHNEGYSPMCGHACISLGRYAVDKGLFSRPITSPETQVNIQVPCGMVKAYVQVDPSHGRKTGRVRFESMPSFVVATDVELSLDNVGTIKVDVSYGGAFYAFVAAADVGLSFEKDKPSAFSSMGSKIKNACIPVVSLSHPDVPAFLYGVIFIDSRNELFPGRSSSLCIFGTSQTDRSPCGSGTSAHCALLHHRGLLGLGEERSFRNPLTGSEFVGKPTIETSVGDKKAVVTEVAGHGYYAGMATFQLEKGDILGRGFLLR